MKKLFVNLRYKLQGFMQGRYGFDELCHCISITAFILLLLACFIPKLGVLYYAALLLLLWSWYRSLSKNCGKRRQERDKYLSFRRKSSQKYKLIRNVWHDRKTHRYYKCPNCKTVVRIPKPGKGRNIAITCPKCCTSFNKKT